MDIKLILGLGNDESSYTNTRHNYGFALVDSLANKLQASWQKKTKLLARIAICQLNGAAIILAKPTLYMNESGKAAARLGQYYKLSLEQMLVIHDELELAVGQARYKFAGGHGGHNGIRSIMHNLHDNNFYRLRIGIGRPLDNLPVSSYVLSRPTTNEANILEKVIQKTSDDMLQALPTNENNTMQDIKDS